MELTVHLPRYHLRQLQFRNSPAKRKVIAAGRRGGKTHGVAGIAVEALGQRRRVLEAAPVLDQTEAFWVACKRMLREPLAAGVARKNETDRLIEMDGGRIRCKTAHDADSLRGDSADLLILDEFSLMDESAWTEVGAPMLLDNNGDAVFIGTPQRHNHFYTLFQRARADDTGRWAAFHFPSTDNPYLSREALAEITGDMTQSAYRQEILAEFLAGEGAVFRNIAACMGAPATTPDAHKGHRLVMGVDWAKSKDYTCLSLMCATCKHEVAHDRFNTVDYVIQRGRLAALAMTWQVSEILAESNSIGEPNLEMLRRDDALKRVGRILGFETTAVSKPPLIESLVLAFDRVECQWLPDPIWRGELEAYEMKTSVNAGRPTYSAPEGMHDDTVMARALAWQQALRVNLPATVMDSPFL